MPAHSDKYISLHTPEELFSIVADVEKYPDFLPWVAATRIVERGHNYFLADLVVNFKAFSQKYTSRVELHKPKDPKDEWKIDVISVRGPFKYLNTYWKFKELGDGKTEIHFDMDFKFESSILEKMIGFVFEKAVHKMTMAFEKRADDLLGKRG